MKPTQLTVEAYLEAFKCTPSHQGITGGTIHDFLRESKVTYYRGGKCPVYLVEHYHNGRRAVVGGNYATSGKPELVPFQPLDFD